MDGQVDYSKFLHKCVFYLWHDVFKDEQFSELSPFRSDGPKTFNDIQAAISRKGLVGGFKDSLLQSITKAQDTQLESDSDTELSNEDDHSES